jgi:prevent-host-death family protein
MTEVNIHEAKTHLSRLLQKVAQGEEVVIAKAGRPVAKLVKIEPKSKRVLGSATGTIKFTPGWDAPMTDEEFDEFIGG